MYLTKAVVTVGLLVIFAGVILLAVAPAYLRDTQRISELNQIQKALEFYYADHKTYPQFTAFTTSEKCGFNWCKLETALSSYMRQLPRDPIGPNNEYAYYYDSSSGNGYQSYGLMARMEKSFDDERINEKGFYEIGTRPLYCERKYANSSNPSDKNWWPYEENIYTVCKGGN